MRLRVLIVMLALCSGFTVSLSAGTERADSLFEKKSLHLLPALLALKGHRDHKVYRAYRALPVVYQDPQDPQALLDQQVFKGFKVLKVLKELPVPPAVRVLRVQLEPAGLAGTTGPTGPQGIQGVQGTPGGVPGYADFFALMPNDNTATIAVGTPVSFPQSIFDSGIVTSTATGTLFIMNVAGVYLVNFQVSVSEPGQLMLRVNGSEVPGLLVGRSTGTLQLVGTSLLTLAVGDHVEVINPSENSTALTITPVAGGTHSVSAHLVFTKIQ